MAVGHIAFDPAKPHGQDLQLAFDELKRGINRMREVYNVMTQMKDGDGSLVTHFAYSVDKYGFGGADTTAKQTAAKAAYDEISSLLNGKLDTDASVSNVKAAIAQAIAKFDN